MLKSSLDEDEAKGAVLATCYVDSYKTLVETPLNMGNLTIHDVEASLLEKESETKTVKSKSSPCL